MRIVVTDRSKKANFHLLGKGVDRRTGVKFKGVEACCAGDVPVRKRRTSTDEEAPGKTPGVTRTVVVVAGGSAPSPRGVDAIPAGAAVITADSGADHALALELPVELAVGTSTATPEALDALAARGARIEASACQGRHRSRLALQAALTLEPPADLVVGGIEGRLDHLLGELHVLGSDALAGVELDAVLGDALVHVIRGGGRCPARRRADLAFRTPRPGDGDRDRGPRLSPPRRDARSRSSRGISNEFSETERESPSRPAYCSQTLGSGSSSRHLPDGILQEAAFVHPGAEPRPLGLAQAAVPEQLEGRGNRGGQERASRR